MRVLLLALLLLPSLALAADPWGNRLKAVFPNAAVIETFDDIRPWRPTRTGSITTQGLPVKNDGSPSQVFYYVDFSTLDEDYAIKDHGPGNSVTGQSVRLSWVNVPRSQGVSHLAYYWGDGSPTSGLTEMYAFWRFKVPKNSVPTSIDSTANPKKGYFSEADTTYAGINKLAAFMHGMTAPTRWNYTEFGPSNTFPRNPYGSIAVVPHIQYANYWGIPHALRLMIQDGESGDGNWPVGCTQGEPGSGCGLGYVQPRWYMDYADSIMWAGKNGEHRTIQTDVWAALEVRAKLNDEAVGGDDLQIWYYTPEGVKTELDHQAGTAWLHNLGYSYGHKWNTMFLGGNTSSAYYDIDDSMEGHFFSDDLIIADVPIGDKYFAELATYMDGKPPELDIIPPVSRATADEGFPKSVQLSASEPAAIYYTTDGTDPRTSTTRNAYVGDPIVIRVTTTLKFYAQDTAGNAEEPQTVVYTITLTEPPKVPAIKANGRMTAR